MTVKKPFKAGSSKKKKPPKSINPSFLPLQSPQRTSDL
jgi:hypothetical protein